jgi:glucosamine--fructose-6-phosphate aminotransferase (isomerizing)
VLAAAPQCKEVALIHSEGILAGEMKHGPLALVDEHLPIVVVATRDSMYSKMESVIQQLLARNARLVILATEGDKNMRQYVEGHDCRLIEVSACYGVVWMLSCAVVLHGIARFWQVVAWLPSPHQALLQ